MKLDLVRSARSGGRIGALACALAGAPALTVQAAPAPAADPNAIERGRYLFVGADCAGCHAGEKNPDLPSGGLGLDTPFGTFRAPNITPDSRYGIGKWSEADLRRALRHGVGREGEYLFPVFPYPSFTRLSDGDIADLYAYLMSLPAVPEANRPHETHAPFSWRWLLVGWRTLFFSEGAYSADVHHDADWNRGNYLVHAVAHCEECHTPRNSLGALQSGRAFSGNVGGPDGQNAPNITSDVDTGIGTWSMADIERLLKTGLTPDSDQVGSGMKAVVRGTSKMTPQDRHAIAVYLKTVAPIHVDPQPVKPADPPKPK